MMTSNLRILLKSRPDGLPVPDNFTAVEAPVPQPADGELLVQNLLLSLDPYMRFLMSPSKAYSDPLKLGTVMEGRTVARVLESRDSRFRSGDYVVGAGNWQTYSLLTAQTARKLEPTLVPLSTALGVLGWPGQTAWIGMTDIAAPKAGETVVVSAAAGAVGSIAGQIAKVKGCRVVGIAAGAEKGRFVVDDLGFDACVDHRESNFAEALAAACPNGIDIVFENVGSDVLKTSWPLLNPFARVLICGLIAEYHGAPPPGPELYSLMLKRIRVEGFFIMDHLGRTQAFLDEVTPWVRTGRIKYPEQIVDGLENAPDAFVGLFHGRNLGKLIVRIAN
jgi:NADPH-dependent curcumin reductase CurA